MPIDYSLRRSHRSDDKKHGLKELASLDLVTEGGQRGIDVSTAWNHPGFIRLQDGFHVFKTDLYVFKTDLYVSAAVTLTAPR